MKTLTSILATGALVATSALATTLAHAQETINVTVVSGYPPTASWVRVFEEFFIPEVDQRLAEANDYQINWNKGFSGTIVKPRGELEAVSTGIGDMGIVVPPFHVDKLPLFNVSFVTPFSTGDLHLVTETVSELAKEIPEMAQEFEALNQVYLGSSGTVDNYQAVCKAPMEAVADFEGVKVVGAGTNLRYFQGVGAVGISSNLADYYNQLQTGVAECASVWAESAAGFKLYEVAPYFIKADQGATTSFAITANKQFWEGLPEPVQQVLRETSEAYGQKLADYVVNASQTALETFAENGGTIIEYTQEQREEWAQALPNIAQEWVEQTEAQGKPAGKVLEAYMNALREAGEPVSRDWDRE
ncbi:C4-dicarboxylate TRAP transporter substrate-binding protein [Aquibium sp. A9E412]|uniref:C4-dicarboxylate TRAP transporter substrate-binding protein n=1 Tax=Aquibium sp. A9E412 TaxID=2976767 RepID=UPI0025AF26E0|nr:C4-dicarboxylate TRAP transporter substrate-binding protein [Aquibium sp. A9E412]MDN2567612.1 C4-dicarboxylate TRAP transporter substrate-binding protein [Aquibium sp. A9E412]